MTPFIIRFLYLSPLHIPSSVYVLSTLILDSYLGYNSPLLSLISNFRSLYICL